MPPDKLRGQHGGDVRSGSRIMFQTFDQSTDSSASSARVAALRDRLRAEGVDGFLVPRADAHQGETVAPRDERREP